MKLYYAPGTCSLVPHVLLRETGTPFSLARVDLKTHTVEGEGAFHAINPKGKVPVLEIADGQRLTEGPVISQFIVDEAGASHLLPGAGDRRRYRVLEWQTFVSSELHKTFSPLFNPASVEATKGSAAQELRRKFTWVDEQLSGRDFLTGNHFSVADAYLFTVARWTRLVGPDLSDLPQLQSYLARIAARPAVRDALRVEGLAA